MVESRRPSSGPHGEERRQEPRLVVPKGIPIKTQVETFDRILRQCRCVNIGAHGALLDFGDGRCPELPIQSKLMMTVELGGDVARIPGLVMHRYGNCLGIYFPIDGEPDFADQAKSLGFILRTLDRGIQRRKGR